jgi:S-adenosylmethionine decarboxylase
VASPLPVLFPPRLNAIRRLGYGRALVPSDPAQPPTGRHLILDAWGCAPDLLDDPARLEAALRAAVTAGHATLIDLCVHRFSPIGVTATATLAESHIAIHTWPEDGYCAADLFFCNSGDPDAALAELLAHLRPNAHDVRRIDRGRRPAGVLPAE